MIWLTERVTDRSVMSFAPPDLDNIRSCLAVQRYDQDTAPAYCLAILESTIRAVEAFASEYCPEPTIALMRDTAGVIAACFAHGQTFGQDGGEVGHGR